MTQTIPKQKIRKLSLNKEVVRALTFVETNKGYGTPRPTQTKGCTER